MKNYWLIAGGIAVGLGLSELGHMSEYRKQLTVKGGLPMKDAEELKKKIKAAKTSGLFTAIAGVLVIVAGLKGFDK